MIVGKHVVPPQALSKLGVALNITGGRCRGAKPGKV